MYTEHASKYAVAAHHESSNDGNEPTSSPVMQMFVDAFQAAIMACKGEYVRGSPMAQRLDRLCFESGVPQEHASKNS